MSYLSYQSDNAIFLFVGGVFLIYSAPVLLSAFLASAYIYLRDEEDENHVYVNLCWKE